MKEQELIDLGFKRTDVSAEESGDNAFHYYTYDFGNESLSLISNANDETVDDNWHVEIFEDETIRFTDKDDLKVFIKIINKNTLRDDSI